MSGHRVHEVHRVAVGRQPPGVHAGAAAAIQDSEATGRQMPADDLLYPYQLELAKPGGDALALVDLVRVVADDLRRDVAH
jgi:hypothetical protein